MNHFFESKHLLLNSKDKFLPSILLNNVIFGYYEGKIKILLKKLMIYDKWMLPEGFIYKTESVEEAAYRALKENIGIDNILLTQFHVFGEINRLYSKVDKNILNQRYVSIGYYAFVNYSKVKMLCNEKEEIRWFDINKLPKLYGDHNKIINTAIFEICKYINHIPIGYELLPEKFTMSELRLIYEAFLGENLDRRNFQRKMLSMGFINKLNEKSEKRGIKPTILYSFKKDKYMKCLMQFLKL